MDWLAVPPLTLALLFCAALFAGFIDSIAGGGGLITLPALLAAGLTPAQTLGTSKLQSIGGSFSASYYFIRQKAVDIGRHKLTIALTFIGSMSGALLIQHLRADLLRQLLPLLVIGIGLYFLLMPRIGEQDRQRRLGPWPFALAAGLGVGFYDGFFGPAAGSFYALAYVTLCGFNLPKATAHAKVLNFTSNLGGLLLFIFSGKVVWIVGVVMLAGQVIGARLGAGMVLSRGQRLIRPMIVVVSLLMSIKLIYDSHGSQIVQWLATYLRP